MNKRGYARLAVALALLVVLIILGGVWWWAILGMATHIGAAVAVTGSVFGICAAVAATEAANAK